MDVHVNNYLGIDLGTSSVKAAVFSDNLEFLCGTSERYGIKYLEGGGAEQSPSEWWKALVKACGMLSSQFPEHWNGITGVAVTGQFSGTIPLDASGNPLMDAIIWLDSRGEVETRKLISGFPGMGGYRIDKLYSWIHLTGGAPTRSGKDSISHILFLKKEYPEIFKKTRMFMEPKDYINYRLTGKFVSTFDNMVLHWITDNRDPDNIHYSKSLLKMVGLDQSPFPSLVGSWEAIGHPSDIAAKELGIRNKTVVAGGSGDIQSAIIGSGCLDNLEPILYIGSSSWVSCHVPYKKTDLMHNIASLPSALPGKYFVAAEQENAGSALTYVKDLFQNGIPISYSELDEVARMAPPGSDGLIFLPWLYGERAPVESKSLRSSFFNISLMHKKPHFVRAVMEGVGYNTRWLLGSVEKFVGKELPYLVMSGGGASSEFWAQTMADILNREIRTMDNPFFVNSRGAAILALMAKGMNPFEVIRQKDSQRTVYKPDSDASNIHKQNYEAFIRFYKDNRKSLSLLNT